MAYPHKREKIEATVRRWLLDGKYKPGDRFPSDQELARRFKVTHVTVRGALKPLVDAGVLERHIGQGTVVRASDDGLPGGRPLSSAVGVAIPENTHSFFGELLKGVEAALFPTRRPLVLSHTWEIGERERAAVTSWIDQGLVRLILVPTVGDPAFYRDLLARGVRLVLVDRTVEGVDVPAITSRDQLGSERVTRLLIELGHRRLLHLAGPPGASTARARLDGFRQAVDDAGLPPASVKIVNAGFFMEDGHRAMREALRSGPPPEAVFATNDPVAVGAIQALAEAGLEVPKDVSVAGYADTDLARNFNLTSVRQFPEKMGNEAVRLLIAGMPLSAAHSLQIEPETVVRQSTTARSPAIAAVRSPSR